MLSLSPFCFQSLTLSSVSLSTFSSLSSLFSWVGNRLGVLLLLIHTCVWPRGLLATASLFQLLIPALAPAKIHLASLLSCYSSTLHPCFIDTGIFLVLTLTDGIFRINFLQLFVILPLFCMSYFFSFSLMINSNEVGMKSDPLKQLWIYELKLRCEFYDHIWVLWKLPMYTSLGSWRLRMCVYLKT